MGGGFRRKTVAAVARMSIAKYISFVVLLCRLRNAWMGMHHLLRLQSLF